MTKLTPWGRVFEKLMDPELFKYPMIYGAAMLIAVFRRGHHLSLF
jgi:hypothetical protein